MLKQVINGFTATLHQAQITLNHNEGQAIHLPMKTNLGGKTSSSNTEVKKPITLSTEAGHCVSLSHLAFCSCAHRERKTQRLL